MLANTAPGEKAYVLAKGLSTPGAGYGDTVAREAIAIQGLSAESASAATQNTAIIQAALNGRGRIAITEPGVIHITSGGAGSEILKVYSDTDLYIGPRTTIRGPGNGTYGLPLMATANWRSNALEVTSIAGVTSSAPTRTVCTVVLAEASGLAAGDFLLIKGDTTGGYNGIHRIVSVATDVYANDTVVFHMYGLTADPPAAAGTIICYPADGNIHVHGPGVLDANRNDNTNGAIGALGKMGVIFQKIGHWSFSVPVINSSKYGLYYGNSWHARLRQNGSQSPSNPYQGVGPLHDTRIEVGSYGESGDDFYAFTANSGGYTSYDVKDLDGTKSSDGDVIGFYAEGAFIGRSATRIATLAGGDGCLVKDVAIINTSSPTSEGGLYVHFEVPPNQTATFESVRVEGLVSNQRANASLVLIHGTAPSTCNIKDLSIKNVRSHGGAVNGGTTGLTAPVLSGGSCTINLTGLKVDDVDVDLDLTNAAAAVNLVSFGVAAAVHTVNGIQLSRINARGVGTTRSCSLIAMSNNAQFDCIQLDEVNITGYLASLASISSTQADPATGPSEIIATNAVSSGSAANNGQSLLTISGAKNLDIQLSAVRGRRLQNGGVYVYGGSGKSFNLQLDNMRVGGSKLIVNAGTSHTFNVRTSVVRSDDYSLTSGLMIAVGTTSTWNFHGANFDIGIDLSLIARVTNTLIFNTNAALGTLAAAGLVSGQGATAGSWHLLADPTKAY